MPRVKPATGGCAISPSAIRSPRAACWCAATDPPRMKAFSIPTPANFCGRPRIRAIAAIPAGRAAWPGRCTASPPATNTAATRISCETAQACADYYITHTPADGIPPWDFNAPVENRTLLDTSAAAICAAGLLRLCRLEPDPMKGHLYWSTAVQILRSLCREAPGQVGPQMGRNPQRRRVSRPQGIGRG